MMRVCMCVHYTGLIVCVCVCVCVYDTGINNIRASGGNGTLMDSRISW